MSVSHLAKRTRFALQSLADQERPVHAQIGEPLAPFSYALGEKSRYPKLSSTRAHRSNGSQISARKLSIWRSARSIDCGFGLQRPEHFRVRVLGKTNRLDR